MVGSGVYVQFTSVFIMDVYLPLVVSPTIDRASVCACLGLWDRFSSDGCAEKYSLNFFNSLLFCTW